MYSFGLLKADCQKRGLSKQILDIINSSGGIKVVCFKPVKLNPYQVSVLWSPCVGQPFYNKMVQSYTGNESIIFLVEGNNAIEVLNDLVGCYDPYKAKKYTLRNRFGLNKMDNIIHSTSNLETLITETALFTNF